MDAYDTALVLGRVLGSGVVMSIEKNDRELPALERLLARRTGYPLVSLVNSGTAALHAALAGQGIGYGDEVAVPVLPDRQRRFLRWLGVRARPAGDPDRDPGGGPVFGWLAPGAADVGGLGERAAALRPVPAVALDLTALGFGPAGAVLTDREGVWARAERLKIFGSFDLRTMWTQEETDPDRVPGVQFNYRLSPLVAACLRMALTATPAPTSPLLAGADS